MATLWEVVGIGYDEPGHLLGVIALIQVAVRDREEQARLLREWLDLVGREEEGWMYAVLAGPVLAGRDMIEEIERG